MDLGLQDRVALVAGASKGLGFAVALALAAEGAKVAIGARDKEQLGQAAERIRQKTGREVLAVPCDVTQPAQYDAWFQQTVERYGQVDILVTNAGGPTPGTFESLTEEQWDGAVQLTLKPVVHAIRLALPGMKQRRWGRILNMTSVAVKQPLANLILSNSLRSAVVGLAKTLASEIAPFGVTVNNLAPGYFETERLIQLMHNSATKEGVDFFSIRERFRNQIPAKRLGEVQEFGDFAAFLCSTRAAYITGATFQIDGGMHSGLL